MSHTGFAGNIVDQVELRQTKEGEPVTSFRVAEDRGYMHNGQWVELPTNFHNVSVKGRSALHLAESLTKGSEVVVIGHIATETWENNAGERRSKQVIRAERVGAGLTFRPVNPQQRPAGAPTNWGRPEDGPEVGPDGWPTDNQ